MISEGDRLLIQQIRRRRSPRLGDADRPLRGPTAGLRPSPPARFVGGRGRGAGGVHRLSEQSAQFRRPAELQTYLFTIASHKLTDHLRKTGRHPLKSLAETGENLLEKQFDQNPGASSRARSEERKELESEAIVRCLGQILRDFRDRGEWVRLKVLELLWVKGWGNRETAQFLGISEQQVANYRFAAVKKLTEAIRAAGLSSDVFPELYQTAEEEAEE